MKHGNGGVRDWSRVKACWTWWEKVGKWLSVLMVGWLAGWLHAVYTFASRVTLPVILSAVIVSQAHGQEFTLLQVEVRKGTTNDINLICGMIYGGIICTTAAAGYECYVYLKRAATCIASNQNWKLTNAMNSAMGMFPTNTPIAIAIGITAKSAFEPNCAVEYSDSPGGPWRVVAEWREVPPEMDADLGARYVEMPKGREGFFRMKSWR